MDAGKQGRFWEGRRRDTKMEESTERKTTVVSHHKNQVTFKGKAARRGGFYKGMGEETEEAVTFGTCVFFPMINFKYGGWRSECTR